MGKPLYENVGIGMIIKRIGECNANVNDYALLAILTQQTGGRGEARCRDLCITAGSKIAIIEFKAPNVNAQGVRIYKLETKVPSLAARVGSRNFFFGLLHATLASMPSSGGGYYRATAVPATTRFLSLDQLGVDDKKLQQNIGKDLNLGNLRVFGVWTSFSTLDSIYCDGDQAALAAYVPSCAYVCLPGYCRYSCYIPRRIVLYRLHDIIVKCDIVEYAVPCLCICVSCGSLCDSRLDGTLNGKRVKLEVLSLASLLWGLRSCRIGYCVRDDDEAKQILEEIMRAAIDTSTDNFDVEPAARYNTYVLIYTPGFGFSIVPLTPRHGGKQ